MSSEKEFDDSYYQQFVGKSLGTKAYRIKGKKMSRFSASLTDEHPNYYVPKPAEGKPNFDGIVAHPAYASTYTIPGILQFLPDVEDTDGDKLCTNIYKLLHTKQEYTYEGCAPLTPDVGRVWTDGTILKIWIKNGMLWVELEMITTNEEKSKIYCKTILGGILRQGGFKEVYKNA